MAASEYKTLSAKVTREESTLVEEYCRRKESTPSALIRELLLREIRVSTPHHIAGSNKIQYNKDRDNFTWKILLDEGVSVDIIKNISPEYVEQLGEQITTSLTLRQHTIKRTRKGSVPVPTAILGRKK